MLSIIVLVILLLILDILKIEYNNRLEKSALKIFKRTSKNDFFMQVVNRNKNY